MEQLLVAEFQYNGKKHIITGYILFKLNYKRYLWKEELNSEDRITKAERFLQETTKKLESYEKINENAKRSHEETIQQERTEANNIYSK